MLVFLLFLKVLVFLLLKKAVINIIIVNPIYGKRLGNGLDVMTCMGQESIKSKIAIDHMYDFNVIILIFIFT